MAPPVRQDTPRLKFQFRHLDRAKRHAALRIIFDELNAHSLSDRRNVIRRIEQIVFVYRAHPKTHYKTTPTSDKMAT